MQIRKKFIKYVSESVFGMLGLSCYILADTFFIARGVGENGLTALNLAIPVFSLMTGVGLMIGIGGATHYSLQNDRKAFTQSAYMGLIFSALFMAVGILLSTPIAYLLGADERTVQNTAVYLKIILSLAPFFIASNLLSAFIRNDNAPKLAMIAQLTGSFSNIVLDYIFIYPLKMGMKGAAIATCLSPIISITILSLHFIKKKNSFTILKCAPNLRPFLRICTLGVSALITELSSAVVIIVFNIVILNIAGNTGVAAYGIIANIALVVTSIFTGIAQGMQPLVSELKRNGEKKSLQSVIIWGLSAGVILSAVIYIISFMYAREITDLFNSENSAALRELAERGIRIYFTSFLFSGINIVVSSSLSASDRPIPAFVISSLRGFVLLIPATFILAYAFGIDGVWTSVPASELICVVFSAVFAKKSVK